MNNADNDGIQESTANARSGALQIRDGLQSAYSDIYTPEVLAALSVIAHFNVNQKAAMAKRCSLRTDRARNCRDVRLSSHEDALVYRYF